MAKKHTKKALFTSVMSLVLCFAMLVGTTFAWFTDSVTSGNNIIKSGNLDVEMYWADGTQAVPTEDSGWTDASQGAIFDYDNWEPGYTQVRHIKIVNKGTLALKYQVSIVANGAVSELSDVIDVYYVDPAVQVENRTDLTDDNKLGTLTQVLAKPGETGYGELEAAVAGDEAHTTDTITLAFKMQENAGNNYMGKSIGADFSVVLMATQLTSEEDSFDNQYDNGSMYPEVSIGNVTKGEEATSVKSEDETVKIDIPEEAPAGKYALVVSNKNVKTDADSNTTVSMDISLLKDGAKVEGNENTVYTAAVNVGKFKTISNVMHNGTALTKADTGADQTYTYNSTIGVLTIYTSSFSPFAITYSDYKYATFADESWDAIIYACQNNSVPASWNVGDKKTMTIGGSTYNIAIIGKNHDEYTDGSGNAPLTFQLAEVYGTTAKMNETQTNTTGWSGSAMRNTTMVQILSDMPSEVQNAVKAVNKYTLNGTRDGLETTSDKLFLLSEIEVNGSNFYSNGFDEGSRYPYYTDVTSQIMDATWWLRGPGKGNDIGFTQIITSGYMANGSAEYACGVVFGFCF